MNIKITHDDNYLMRYSGLNFFNFELTGKGTNQEPYVMRDNSILVFSSVVILISDSKDHLVIDNIQVKAINLVNCENIILKHSKAKLLELNECLNCKIQDAVIKKKIKVYRSIDISLEDVVAKKLLEFENQNTSLKNCQVKKS